ncbi:hypothetical protein ACWDZX_23480 [Streptomyces collinus]
MSAAHPVDAPRRLLLTRSRHARREGVGHAKKAVSRAESIRAFVLIEGEFTEGCSRRL